MNKPFIRDVYFTEYFLSKGILFFKDALIYDWGVVVALEGEFCSLSKKYCFLSELEARADACARLEKKRKATNRLLIRLSNFRITVKEPNE